MIWDHRSIVAVIVFAFTILGVSAGVRIAQIEERQKWENLDSNKVVVATPAAPIKTDAAFYAEKAPVKKPASATAPAPVPERSVPSDGITAEAYVIGDLETGKIYLSRNPDEVLPFASMSKLITALIATDIYSPSAQVTITEENTKVPADASRLQAGEKFTVKELLYPLLLNSSNVAGEAIASAVDRTNFLKLMSDYSWELGMPESRLADPTGLSSSNSGTARGFFGLAQYLYRERPDILDVTRNVRISVATTSSHGAHIFTNIHPFADDPRFLGGKTGYTSAALDTMLTILKIKDRPIAFVILRSDNRAHDTTILSEKVTKMSL